MIEWDIKVVLFDSSGNSCLSGLLQVQLLFDVFLFDVVEIGLINVAVGLNLRKVIEPYSIDNSLGAFAPVQVIVIVFL